MRLTYLGSCTAKGSGNRGLPRDRIVAESARNCRGKTTLDYHVIADAQQPRIAIAVAPQ
jgi:hypothetical protein